jgi:hypothetical protein
MDLRPWLEGLFQENASFSSYSDWTASLDGAVVGGRGSTPSVQAGGSLAGKDSAIASSTTAVVIPWLLGTDHRSSY